MYDIDIQNELQNLSDFVQQQKVSLASHWRIDKQGSLQHWQDILAQLESAIEENSLWFNVHEDAEQDVYLLMEQEIVFKQCCLDLTYLLHLGYVLGLNQAIRIVLYTHILNIWLAYADLLAVIQQKGQMQAVAPLILEVDYATALLLMTGAIVLDEGDSVVKIVHALLYDQTDCLLDILIYPYFQVDEISTQYTLAYPYACLAQCLNQEMNVNTLATYLAKIEQDQRSGVYWQKKNFHRLQVLGQWSFEALALAVIYQLDLSQLSIFTNFPQDF